jgi:hypothetical protein
MRFWRGANLRVVALLLAAVVCGDVTLDAGCDPIEPPGLASGVATVSASGAWDGDACASFCIADCFCCSRGETPGPAVTLPPLVDLAQAPSPSPASVPAVARSVAEPPPLALS